MPLFYLSGIQLEIPQLCNFCFADDKAKKIDFGRELLTIFDKLDPGLSHSRGMTLYELYKVTQKSEIVPEIIRCLEMEPKESAAGRACENLTQILKKL